MIFSRDKRPKTGLAASDLARNMIRTSEGVVHAWYHLGPHRWSLRSLEERERMHSSQMSAWASLAGYSVRVRATSVPFPRAAWARRLDESTPDHLPDQPNGITWEQWLVNQQERVTRTRLAQPFRAVGVRLKTRVSPEEWAEFTSGRSSETALDKELSLLDRSMRSPGFSSRSDNRLSPRELWWLMHRSVGLGLPTPDTGAVGDLSWGPGHMAEFTDPVSAFAEPNADSVRLETVRNGEKVVRFVVVRDLIRVDSGGRMSAERALEPWLPAIDLFPFEVELSASLDILPGKDLERLMEQKQLRAGHIGRHSRESGRFTPIAVAQAIDLAGQAYHEVTKGGPEESTRVYGTIRMAVSADDEQTALGRAHQLEQYYAQRQRMALVARKGQHGRYREFIPGEPSSQTLVDVERMTNAFWCTAWPGAASNVGDGVGPYTGYTTGVGRRAVNIEPHFPTMRYERSSLFTVTGTLGSGKSYFLGGQAAISAYRGRRVVLDDPDGRLARLAEMPELAPFTTVIELTGSNVVTGTLNPWSLIVEPRRNDFDTEEKWRAEVQFAYMQRRQLAADTVMRFLPATVTRQPGVRSQILSALSQVGSDYGTNPWRVVHILESSDESRSLGKELREAASSPAGLLVFGDEHERFAEQVDDLATQRMTILTSAGLAIPDPDKDPVDWGIEEQLSIPIRTNALFLATRIVFTADRDLLKVVIHDEVGIAKQSAAATRHIQRIGRTNRGNSIAMGLGSQDARDLRDLKLGNWVTRKYLGRAPSVADATIALEEAGLSTDEGFQSDLLPMLSENTPGQFVFVDEADNAEVMQVDYSWWPNLHHALHRERPSMEDVQWQAGDTV